MTDQPTVLGERYGSLGLITLNRPRAINALDLDMIRQLQALVDEYDADDAIGVILMQGAGDRGFCAGGDMVSARAAVLAGDPEPHRFFLEEYTLNATIARCRTPIVAVMDGLVLGGGIGLGGHARHRLVTETSRVGMPEVTIGFVPDVGGTWLLGGAPGETGLFAAMSGEHLSAADALYLGVADRGVDRSALDEMLDRLAEGVAPTDTIDAITVPMLDECYLERHRDWIDRCFAAPDASSVVRRLEASPESEARRIAEVIATKSPSSVVLAHALVRRARTLDGVEAALALEYSTVLEVLHTPDLAEGVRAALVDKDRRPVWNPGRLADVPGDLVPRCFARFDAEPGFTALFATRP